MNFVKLMLDVNYGNYSYQAASNTEMGILGLFLIDDVGCPKKRPHLTYQDWANADKNNPDSMFNYTIGGNATFLEEDENGDIHLTDITEKKNEQAIARITMTREQFVQLLDEWQEKVCQHKPKEVIIKQVNDQFVIETKN